MALLTDLINKVRKRKDEVLADVGQRLTSPFPKTVMVDPNSFTGKLAQGISNLGEWRNILEGNKLEELPKTIKVSQPTTNKQRALNAGIDIASNLLVKPLQGGYNIASATNRPQVSQFNAPQLARGVGQTALSGLNWAGAAKPLTAIGYTVLPGVITGASEALSGKNAKQAVSSGIGASLEFLPKALPMAGVIRGTQPIMDKVIGKASANIRLPIKVGTNVGQGLLIDKASGFETTPESVALDVIFPIAGDVVPRAYKSASEAMRSVEAKVLSALGKKLRNNKGAYTTAKKFINKTRSYNKTGKYAMGSFMGFEPYQDDDGNWRVRFNDKKALTGIGLMLGGTKVTDTLGKVVELKPKTGVAKTLQRIRTAIEDFTAPIEDALSDAEKTGKFKIVPTQDVRYQIDKVLRADSIATQFARDNGFTSVVQKVDDMDAFNQYLIAKQSLDVASRGIKTGRNLEADKSLISQLGGKYEPFAQQIYGYNNKLRNYLVESGLISKDLADKLAMEYPNYVPLKRVFDEVEQEAMRFSSGRGGPASIGSQNVVKRLKGSEREIVNPLESILENTAMAFREGERNKAANMMVGYVKNGFLPGRVLGAGETTVGKHTVSALVGGKKVIIETTPEIATAAKNLNAQQLAGWQKIVAIPTRVLQMGATGLNIPFVLSNLVKDQLTAGIVGSKSTRSSLLNPITFVKALYASVGKGNLYDDWVRSGSSFTSFDIARDTVVPTLNKIRLTGTRAGKVKYAVTHPAELFRALEDAIGTAENVTRIQQYAGKRADLLKQGRTLADADILAANASRFNTANFARKGDLGRVLNQIIPFFNAGIQGARSLRQAFVKDPRGTSFRFATMAGLPIATATLWNLSDPERKKAYDDIQEYEKEGNIVIIPPNPTKDDGGYYNAIKIPVTPGLANLMSVIRRSIEGASGNDVAGAGKMLSDLFAATTSFELPIDAESSRQLISGITPQMLKVPLEGMFNKNLYTGSDIVPYYQKNLPPELQVKKNTSGTARLIGRALGQSPLVVENAFSSGGAGVGRQLLNYSDKLLNMAGVIPSEQVGGRSIGEDIKKRFTMARGGLEGDKLDKAIQEKEKQDALVKAGIGKAFAAEKSSDIPQYEKDRIKYVLTSGKNAGGYNIETGSGGGKYIQIGNKVAVQDRDSIKYIDLNFEVPTPKQTGNTELDKKRRSAYYGDITAKINDVVKLNELGILKDNEAEALILDLQAQKEAFQGKSGGGSGTTKKIKIASPPKMPAVKVAKPKAVKLNITRNTSSGQKIKLPQMQPQTAPSPKKTVSVRSLAKAFEKYS